MRLAEGNAPDFQEIQHELEMLEFLDGESVAALGLTGRETYRIVGLTALADEGPLPRDVTVHADDREFGMRARIDTPFERDVFLQGGILPYTLRSLTR